jgi:copper chaperone CopZ
MGDVTMDAQTFKIKGLHCEACTKLTTKRIKTLLGVADATVDLNSGRAEVVASREVSIDEVNSVLDGSDYSAEEYHE